MEKNHTTTGLGGLESDCAGGWHPNLLYEQSQKPYTPPKKMLGLEETPTEATAEVKPKPKRRTTKKQDVALATENQKDLKKRNIK